MKLTKSFIKQWIVTISYHLNNKLRIKNGQALVEMAIWGVLLLIGATVAISYTLSYYYQQQVMVRNFKMAKKLAGKISKWSGSTVFNTLIEHKPIPILNKLLPEVTYRPFVAQIGLVWSRTLYYDPNSSGTSNTYNVWRVIVDGKNLAKEMNILKMRKKAGKANLAAVCHMDNVFVLDELPGDTVESQRSDIMNELQKCMNKLNDYISNRMKNSSGSNNSNNGSNSSSITNNKTYLPLSTYKSLRTELGGLVTDLVKWFNEAGEIFDDPKAAEKALANHNDKKGIIQKLNPFRGRISGLLNKVIADKASVNSLSTEAFVLNYLKDHLSKARNGIYGLYNYLYHGKWEIDLDMTADAFVNGVDSLPRLIKEHITYLKKGKTSSLKIDREYDNKNQTFKTHYGNKKITIKIPSETWKW